MKEMRVKEEMIYTIGEFTCPACGKHCVIKCKPKKHNPKMRGKWKHWVE